MPAVGNQRPADGRQTFQLIRNQLIRNVGAK